jgi:hypothetical protein
MVNGKESATITFHIGTFTRYCTWSAILYYYERVLPGTVRPERNIGTVSYSAQYRVSRTFYVYSTSTSTWYDKKRCASVFFV